MELSIIESGVLINVNIGLEQVNPNNINIRHNTVKDIIEVETTLFTPE